jgi:hypothetical protein
MLQTIDGKQVFVVEFDTVPETPITGLIHEEAVYETLLSRARGYIHKMFDLQYPRQGAYAEALTQAIEQGIITEGGKYAIHITGDRWEVARVIE